MRTTAKERHEVLGRIGRLGVTHDDACALRRIAMTLHRWFELECGDGNDHASWSIERDEVTGKPYRCVYPHNGPMKRYSIADREKGAEKRLQAIVKRYPTLTPYIQTDPRGASLYLLPQDTLSRYQLPIDQCYNHGVAVY